jgi:hypothetical protein
VRLAFRILGIALLAGIVVSLWRPAWIYGTPDGALAHSVARHIGSPEHIEDHSCVPNQDIWICALVDDGSAAYRVEVDDDGCWEARQIAAQGAMAAYDADPSACLSIRDYIRFGEIGD